MVDKFSGRLPSQCFGWVPVFKRSLLFKGGHLRLLCKERIDPRIYLYSDRVFFGCYRKILNLSCPLPPHLSLIHWHKGTKRGSTGNLSDPSKSLSRDGSRGGLCWTKVTGPLSEPVVTKFFETSTQVVRWSHFLVVMSYARNVGSLLDLPHSPSRRRGEWDGPEGRVSGRLVYCDRVVSFCPTQILYSLYRAWDKSLQPTQESSKVQSLDLKVGPWFPLDT